MEKVTYTRQQLYDLVWESPIRTLAQNLQISDVGLARICRRLAIPLPGRGYWNKLAAGQTPRRTSMADVRDVPAQVSFVIRDKNSAENALPAAFHASQGTPPLQLSNLEAPHEVVRKYRKRLKEVDVDSRRLPSSKYTFLGPNANFDFSLDRIFKLTTQTLLRQ